MTRFQYGMLQSGPDRHVSLTPLYRPEKNFFVSQNTHTPGLFQGNAVTAGYMSRLHFPKIARGLPYAQLFLLIGFTGNLSRPLTSCSCHASPPREGAAAGAALAHL